MVYSPSVPYKSTVVSDLLCLMTSQNKKINFLSGWDTGSRLPFVNKIDVGEWGWMWIEWWGWMWGEYGMRVG